MSKLFAKQKIGQKVPLFLKVRCGLWEVGARHVEVDTHDREHHEHSHVDTYGAVNSIYLQVFPRA